MPPPPPPANPPHRSPVPIENISPPIPPLATAALSEEPPPTELTRQQFFDRFLEAHRRLLRLVDGWTDAGMAAAPAASPQAFNAGEQLHHVIAANQFTAALLAVPPGQPTTSAATCFKQWWLPAAAAPPGTRLLPAAPVLAALAASGHAVLATAALPATQAVWLLPSQALGAAWLAPRATHARLMLEHLLHHTGALHVYARLAGRTPPVLYAPLPPAAPGQFPEFRQA